MESIWLVYCAESAYGRVRAEVRKRDVRARIARVNSVEGAVQLGRACAAADVHVVFGWRFPGGRETVAGMAFVRQSLDGVEVLVIADGCDAPSIAHLLRTGATEVIATGASEDAQVRSEDSTTLEACMEPDEFPQRTGEIASFAMTWFLLRSCGRRLMSRMTRNGWGRVDYVAAHGRAA